MKAVFISFGVAKFYRFLFCSHLMVVKDEQVDTVILHVEDHSLDEVNIGKEEDKVDVAKKEDEKVMIEYVLIKLLQLNFIFARI